MNVVCMLGLSKLCKMERPDAVVLISSAKTALVDRQVL